MNLRDKFIENGIPYDQLDPEMIEIIDVFNFHLGLKTQFCCYGHDSKTGSYVIFDECVTDEEILKLAEQTGQLLRNAMSYYKWVRSFPLRMNWKFTVSTIWIDPDSQDKKTHLDGIVRLLKECKVKE